MINPVSQFNLTPALKGAEAFSPSTQGGFIESVKQMGLGFLIPVDGSSKKDGAGIDNKKKGSGPFAKADNVFDLIGKVEAAERKKGFPEK